MKATPARPKVVVTGGGRGVVGHAGDRLLADLADATGLTSAFSEGLAGLRQRRGGHDPGRIAVDLAVMLADGGEAIADLGVLRDQSGLFGPVASDPTAWRLLAGLDESMLAQVRAARAAARAPPDTAVGPGGRVSEMQTKLHRWAAADPGRRFDDLFNLVHDPATLVVALDRVAGNKGARTAGVDGLTMADIEQRIGVPHFLDQLRTALKAGTFAPLPVRERKIPKPGSSGRVRRLGIPTLTDRVVQVALKLVLEPIFEADFQPVSYGFRPRRRAHDAIAEIHLFGTKGYRWVLDADIEACFDSISHSALMDRVRARVKDKRVLSLVKAFLKAGLLTELGKRVDTPTGTPQGGILSPLLANIALSALDEHLHGPWQPAGTMGNVGRRVRRRAKGLPTWRVVRYADDFVVLVHGTRSHVEALHDEIAQVLEPLGLRLSPAKTRITHMSDGFDFLGFHIQWRRKRGTDKWYVYTFIAERPIKSLKKKIRDLTRRVSQARPGDVLIRINQILAGWANYFKHAVAKHTLRHLRQFVWWRIIRWLTVLHRWRWKQIRKRFTDHTGRWLPISADGISLFDLDSIAVTRYRYRGAIPNPWQPPRTRPT